VERFDKVGDLKLRREEGKKALSQSPQSSSERRGTETKRKPQAPLSEMAYPQDPKRAKWQENDEIERVDCERRITVVRTGVSTHKSGKRVVDLPNCYTIVSTDLPNNKRPIA